MYAESNILFNSGNVNAFTMTLNKDDYSGTVLQFYYRTLRKFKINGWKWNGFLKMTNLFLLIQLIKPQCRFIYKETEAVIVPET